MKRILFDAPGIIFDIFLKKYNLSNSIKNIKINWMDIIIPSKYVVLPQCSLFEKPTLIYLDFRATDIKSVKVILLNNLPILNIDGCVEDFSLDQHSSIEVGEFEIPSSMGENILGYKVDLYMEFHSIDMGIIRINDEKLIFTNLYSIQMKSLVYDLYLSENYSWVEGYFKTVNGEFLPILNDSSIVCN